MKAVVQVLLTMILLAVTASVAGGTAREGLPSPRPNQKESGETAPKERARRLYNLAHKVNSGLSWDECLAERAAGRAKTMVKRNYFAHKDPRTGLKPAWYLVRSCHKCKYAGENLARGEEPPEVLHEALMQSPTHRKNLLDKHFRLLGVGCFEDVCVQLFAGF